MGIGADYFSAVMHQELLVLGALFATVTGQYCRLLGKTARTLVHQVLVAPEVACL